MSPAIAMNCVQDTARWAAVARAIESKRKDALFRDPFAELFVGDQMAQLTELSKQVGSVWPVVTRTVLLDRLLLNSIRDGVDAVLNLAAGYDTRPYRLALPQDLVWLDVDHAEVLAAKAQGLGNTKPSCVVERHSVDLADEVARQGLLGLVKQRFARVLVLTEGLLYYLTMDAALQLAGELHELHPQRWFFDIHNPALNRMILKRSGKALQGTATMHFASDRGAEVFEQAGWQVHSVTSTAKAAGKLGRLPWYLALLTKLPEPTYGRPNSPWAGVCTMIPIPLQPV